MMGMFLHILLPSPVALHQEVTCLAMRVITTSHLHETHP